MKKLLLLVFVFALFGCDKGAKTPEGLIKKYVTEITTTKVDKDFFEKHTTGDLWGKISELDEEEFKKFVNLGKIKNPKVDISNKICSGDSCTVTYIIKYNIADKKSTKFETEVKKVATVIKDGEFWKIAEVTNIKTFHDSIEPINALEKNN